MKALRGPVDRRVRVLCRRRRLEDHAATLVERATGSRPRGHRNVRPRLLLLADARTPAAVRAAHALARRAAGVYAETSTVLHSTRAFGDLPEVLVREWEAVVGELDEILAAP